MLTRETAYKIIEAGIAAPSGDNLQPWRFRWDGENSIDIDIDIDSSLYNIFYRGYKIVSLVAAGAGVENMRISAAGLGYQPEIVYFPHINETIMPRSFERGANPAVDGAGENENLPFVPLLQRGIKGDLKKGFSVGKKNCVARIILSEKKTVVDPLSLSSWIPRRCVNRKAYDNHKIDDKIKDSILKETQGYGQLGFYWIEDRDKIRDLADMVRTSDQIMFENRQLLYPLMASIRWRKQEAERKRDGMPIESLELGWFESRGFRLFSFWHLVRVLNYLGLSKFASLHSAKLTESSSALCLFTTQGDNLESYLRGGQLLERVWLKASSLGIAVQPMAGAAFLIARLKLVQGEGLSLRHRDRIRYLQDALYPLFGLNEHEVPLMLLRLGYAPAPSARALRQRVESLSNL